MSIEIQRRVMRVRLCRHDLAHYRDENRNRCCAACDGFVRPNGAVLTVPIPERIAKEPQPNRVAQ